MDVLSESALPGPLDLARYRLANGARAFEKWLVPYVGARLRPGRFRPLLSYLFTDWRCNMRCAYCFTYDGSVEGMTPEVARRSIDWLRTTGCRVVAIMGGEPLVRKDFVVDVVSYAVRRKFFVYLSTNGALVDASFVDRVGRAGVAAINVAVDVVDPKPGLPKALSRVERNVGELIARHREHGFLVFLNVNITRDNLGDVKVLSDFALAHDIGVDYHVTEPPVVSQPHRPRFSDDMSIDGDHLAEAEELVDWLVGRYRRGQPMVNSLEHLLAMKRFMRGELEPWGCRAGVSSSAIRTDGTLSPCFGRYAASEDWGRIGAPRFDSARLDALKATCSRRCLSTCQFNLQHFYSATRVLGWLGRHSIIGGRESPDRAGMP